MQCLAKTLIGPSALGIELVGEDRIPQDETHLTPDMALIEAELRRGPLGLIDLVKEARTRQTGEEPFNLLVLVDQFEEIFTYADAGGRQADESEAFVNLLLASRAAAHTGIYIVLTMRSDFLGDCVRFLELPDTINGAQYLTPRLTREQIERAITGPVQLFGGNVEPTLVAELINAVSNDPDQLPILQHALARMWDKAGQRETDTRYITWDEFKAVGGITNALSDHADEILASLSSENKVEKPLSPEQQAAEVLFRAITEQRGAEASGHAIRRPQSLKRIAMWSGRQWQDFKPVVDAYVQEGVNFLYINAEIDENAVVDISHEALIRQWGRLHDWVTQETRLASEYRRLHDRAEDWKHAEMSQKGSGSLLTGADLARALEWRDGRSVSANTDATWRPSAVWADRYRKTEDETSVTAFNDVLKFINESHVVVLQAERRKRNRTRMLFSLTSLVIAIAINISYYMLHEKKVSWIRVKTPNGTLNYNFRTGAATIEWIDKVGNRQIKDYPVGPGGFSSGWKIIVNTPNGIVYYNPNSGYAAVGRIGEKGYHNTSQMLKLSEGCSSIENTPEGIQCFNAKTGDVAIIGQFDNEGNLKAIK